VFNSNVRVCILVLGAVACGAALPLGAGTSEVAVVRGAARQSSNFNSTQYLASWALDDNAATFTHTANIANSYWEEDLQSERAINKIELVNRAETNTASRMGGLTLRVFGSNMVSVASATVTNPGPGGTWTYLPPAGVTGQVVRVGLEGGVTNQGGNYYVTLAEVRAHAWVPTLSGTNVAAGKDAFMVRLTDSLLPATNANDDSLSTYVETTAQTVDGYWEVDLGALVAITGVRAIEKDGLANRLAHATVRLFDEAHESVVSRHLSVSNVPLFSVDLGDVYCARYVRVGLENKERTSPTGGTEWWLGFKEVQVFGRPAEEVGILDFGASRTNLAAGEPATLTWRVAGVHEVLLTSSAGLATNVTGAGALTVAPAQPVCYTLVATNACLAYERSVALSVGGAPPALRIEEFVADNAVSLEDGYGESPDWIELRNLGGEPVSLLGYGLSDNPSKPLKWTFPDVTVPAYGRLLVCASGRAEKIDPDGLVHASWSLSADGENVVLTAPDGVTRLDAALAYPPQGEDLAYARGPDGAWGFQEPTPGTLNRGVRYAGWLKPPGFSHTRGFYDAPFALALTNSNAGASLLISTNGTEPGILYAGPLTIDETCAVRARVERAGYHSPRTKTHSFVLIDSVLASSVMRTNYTQNALYAPQVRQGLLDLPTVSVAAPEVKDDYYERECSLEILWPGGGEPVQANCGMEQFGGSWQEFTKKSWRFNFRKAFGAGALKAPLLTGFDRDFPVRQTFNKIELRSGSQDMKDRGFYMSARFCDDAMLEMGSLNPHGRYVNLYLNGVYWGQYDLREALDDAFLANYLGGKQSDYLVVRGNDNSGSSFVVGTPDPLARASWYRARDLAPSYHAVEPYLDVPNLVDFMLLWNYGYCEAEYRCAGSVEAGSGFKFWMADSDGFLRVTTANNLANTGPSGLFGKLRSDSDPDFKMLVADRIQKHFFNGGALTPERNLARLNARMGEVENSLVTECARWPYRTPQNWLESAETIRTNFFGWRTAQLFGYLRSAGLYPSFDPPALSQQGGMVTNGAPLTLSAASGTVYYTLDGSDPRLAGGGVAPGARIFSSLGYSQSLIASNTLWRYWDRNGLGGTAWRETAFDDSSWSNGVAELGYGDAPATVIGYGPNSGSKYITSYFRKAFFVQDASAFERLQVSLLRDDGAVVYLNGAELLRSNMPAGTVLTNTPASTSVGGVDESTYFSFDVLAQGLVSGTNVLAVEVHQNSGGSSDLSFNLALSASRTQAAPPLALSSNTVVKSRVWTGSAWSALNEASFYLPGREPASAANLTISEIHYDPPGEADEAQFVELLNVGSNEVDLAGVTLSGAVSFAFPDGNILQPGEVVLVVEDADGFAAVYQTPGLPWYRAGLRVAGAWAGALATGGETLTVTASNGAAIATASFEPGGEWPSRAAGRGSSLELAAPWALPREQPAKDEALSSPESWRSSALYQGSPGRIDAWAKELVISEVLSHTDSGEDWIELQNLGAAPAELGGLWLSDDWANPRRYAIPAGTVLQPGGHIHFARSALGFGFSELGSDALLTEVDGTNLVRFLDTVDFPAAEREEPFGRYARSDGGSDFTELRACTPGASNALPRVGPVVIGELMAAPEPGRAEYAVLVNLGRAPAALYDTNRVANVWALDGAVSFSFPSGLELPAGGALIVCGTNEAAFRAQYAVGPSVPVLGPWQGRLDNAGETLKLLRPGEPEPDGEVPYYRADRVRYALAPPWPAATAGVSLVRVPLESYGCDPASWQAGAPGATPGAAAHNRAPACEVSGAAAAGEGEEIVLSVRGSDPDQPWQAVSLSVGGAPAGASFDAAGGAFTWRTGEADGPGAYELRFCATDSGCAPRAATQTVWVTVSEINRPPQLAQQVDLAYPAGLWLSLPLRASDDDLPAQALAFSQEGLPAGLSLEPATGLLSGRGAEPGSYPVRVVVSDGQAPALAATNLFTLTVAEPMLVRLAAAPADGAGPWLSVPTLPGESYRLEYTDRLSPPDWHTLGTLPGAASNAWHLADPSATNRAQRFYRLLWLR
jgi:hypothetical protein